MSVRIVFRHNGGSRVDLESLKVATRHLEEASQNVANQAAYVKNTHEAHERARAIHEKACKDLVAQQDDLDFAQEQLAQVLRGDLHPLLKLEPAESKEQNG